MLTLALDPSLAETGVAILDQQTERVVTTLAIRTNPAHPEQERLQVLQEGLAKLIKKLKPVDLAIELPFVGINPDTALKLGGVRGMILTLANLHHLRVHEYTTFEVKQAVSGNRTADKEQVRLMVKRLTGIYVANDNISDAIAVGLCHLRHWRFEQALAKAEGQRG